MACDAMITNERLNRRGKFRLGSSDGLRCANAGRKEAPKHKSSHVKVLPHSVHGIACDANTASALRRANSCVTSAFVDLARAPHHAARQFSQNYEHESIKECALDRVVLRGRFVSNRFSSAACLAGFSRPARRRSCRKRRQAASPVERDEQREVEDRNPVQGNLDAHHQR